MTVLVDTRADFTLETARRVAWDGEGVEFGAKVLSAMQQRRHRLERIFEHDPEVTIYIMPFMKLEVGLRRLPCFLIVRIRGPAKLLFDPPPVCGVNLSWRAPDVALRLTELVLIVFKLLKVDYYFFLGGRLAIFLPLEFWRQPCPDNRVQAS